MIAMISGKLVELGNESGLVQIGQICYEVLMPGYLISQLAGSIGKEITLYTLEYYEGTVGSGNIFPRLIGFVNIAEKEFFNKYTSVKGIGVKKALKSLSMPISQIAAAVEDGDEKMLTALPTIGSRLAQQIIAELKGKLKGFAMQATPTEQQKFKTFQTEALEILIAWGEKRSEVIELIRIACEKHPQIKTAEELVPLIYRIKQGAEV